jgi:catechol 2,3-dioxygenase-like lactoylglutathione lyase family enzyme
VRDLAVAESWFHDVLGVPSWFRMENVALGADCSYRGRPSDSAVHLSVGYLRETQIELIEPIRGESLYTEFLDGKGPGLHHLAFDVPDFPATVAALCESGLELIAQGRVGPGSEFAYFDCDTAGTSVIEILGFDEGVRVFMEQLKQASQGAAREEGPA